MQLVAVEAGVILNERVNAIPFENIPVDDVVFDVVAVVQNKREIHDQSGEVAIRIVTIRVVGGKAVVSPELVLVEPIDDDATTGALRVGGVVFVPSHGVELLLVDGVRIKRDVNDGIWIVRILVSLFAAMEQNCQPKNEECGNCPFHVAKIMFFSYFCGRINHGVMKKWLYILIIGVMMLFASSCASNRSSRAIRKAEREMKKQSRREKKEYERAKTAHYKHQAPKTKKMIKEDQRRARRLNRHFRRL